MFSSDAPNRHVVLDDALKPAALAKLRSELLSSWAWHYRAQPGFVLCLSGPESAVIRDVTRRLIDILDCFRPGLEVCEEWAFLHQRPFEEFVHSDIGTYVWTLWLTPEEWDRSPGTSGLRLFPLARPEGMPNRRQHTLEYFEANQVNASEYVPYRENRAVMFPASTFHSIGPCDFDASSAERMRCSVSVFLDHRDHWQSQHQLEELTSETPSP
ncbi:MAG: hypothetical protein ACRDSL_14525 [Pseudonocardiaceae bacterium]